MSSNKENAGYQDKPVPHDGLKFVIATIDRPFVHIHGFEAQIGQAAALAESIATGAGRAGTPVYILQAIRSVTAKVKSGQQYKCWAQLPGGSNGSGPIQAGEWASVEDATKFLWIAAGWPENQLEAVGYRRAVTDAKVLDGVYRDAAKQKHPNKGGSTEAMAKVNRAKDFIEQHK